MPRRRRVDWNKLRLRFGRVNGDAKRLGERLLACVFGAAGMSFSCAQGRYFSERSEFISAERRLCRYVGRVMTGEVTAWIKRVGGFGGSDSAETMSAVTRSGRGFAT
jgi:hypothetical protein